MRARTMAAATVALTAGLVLAGCQVTKDITVPANATASCTVITGPGATTPR